MFSFEATFSPALTDSASARPVVDRAMHWLEAILGPSGSAVRADWDLTTDDTGRETITLRLSDATSPEGLVQRFRPQDLRDRDYAERRFYRLFGDLLQAQSHKLLNDLAGSSAGGA